MSDTLTAEALITVAQARLWITRTTTNTAFDDLLPALINGASDAIAGYTQRQFFAEDSPASKAYRYEGDGFLDLAPYEATAITQVVIGTDLPASSQRTLTNHSADTEAEWRAEPRQKTRFGTYEWMVLPEFGPFTRYGSTDDLGVRQTRGYEVTVTGSWGMAEVPWTAKLACLITVSHWFRNPESFGSRDFGADTVAESFGAVEEWAPPAALGFIEKLRRSV